MVGIPISYPDKHATMFGFGFCSGASGSGTQDEAVMATMEARAREEHRQAQRLMRKEERFFRQQRENEERKRRALEPGAENVRLRCARQGSQGAVQCWRTFSRVRRCSLTKRCRWPAIFRSTKCSSMRRSLMVSRLDSSRSPFCSCMKSECLITTPAPPPLPSRAQAH